jgi:hypothetical protein
MIPFDLVVVIIMSLLRHYTHCASFISWFYKLFFFLVEMHSMGFDL